MESLLIKSSNSALPSIDHGSRGPSGRQEKWALWACFFYCKMDWMRSRVSLKWSESCCRKRLSRWWWPWLSHSLCLCTQYPVYGAIGFHAPGRETTRSIQFGLLDRFPSDSCSSFFGHRGEYWDYVKVLKVAPQKRQKRLQCFKCEILSESFRTDWNFFYNFTIAEISFTIHVYRKDARETQTSFINFIQFPFLWSLKLEAKTSTWVSGKLIFEIYGSIILTL